MEHQAKRWCGKMEINRNCGLWFVVCRLWYCNFGQNPCTTIKVAHFQNDFSQSVKCIRRIDFDVLLFDLNKKLLRFYVNLNLNFGSCFDRAKETWKRRIEKVLTRKKCAKTKTITLTGKHWWFLVCEIGMSLSTYLYTITSRKFCRLRFFAFSRCLDTNGASQCKTRAVSSYRSTIRLRSRNHFRAITTVTGWLLYQLNCFFFF